MKFTLEIEYPKKGEDKIAVIITEERVAIDRLSVIGYGKTLQSSLRDAAKRLSDALVRR